MSCRNCELLRGIVPCKDCYNAQLRARLDNPEPTPEEIERMLSKAGAPEVTLTELRAPLLRTDALTHVRAFLDAKRGTTPILALLGGVGRGKSMAAVWGMREYLKRRGWNKNAATGMPLHLALFVQASTLTRVSNYDKVDGQWLEELESVPFLVLDDAGDEATSTGKDIVSTILLTRYREKRRTILTSNLRQEAFEGRYSKAVADRIRECKGFVELAGKSMRQERQVTP